MAKYEYRILHMPTTSISVLNERMGVDAEAGWNPVLMSGNDHVNILLRRAVSEDSEE